jgi:hypothetical protein
MHREGLCRSIRWRGWLPPQAIKRRRVAQQTVLDLFLLPCAEVFREDLWQPALGGLIHHHPRGTGVVSVTLCW